MTVTSIGLNGPHHTPRAASPSNQNGWTNRPDVGTCKGVREPPLRSPIRPPLALREGLLTVGVAREDEEEVGEAVDDAHGVGVLVCVSGGDEATLRAACYGAGDVEERATPTLTRDDEFFWDLCASAPLSEGVVEELQVILADHIVLLRHRQVAHDAVEEALQLDQEPADLLVRLGAGQAEERARLVHVAEHDYPRVVLAHPSGPEQGRGPVVATAGRDRRVALAQGVSRSLRSVSRHGSPGGRAAQAVYASRDPAQPPADSQVFPAKRTSNSSCGFATKRPSRSPSSARASVSSLESRSKGSIASVTFLRARSVFQTPRTKPSTRKVAGTMPFLEAIVLRCSSPMTRVRSAWERIRLSKAGRKRGGDGRSGPGLGASGRSNSPRPCSSRKESRRGRSRSNTWPSRVKPHQVCASLTPAGPNAPR